VLLQIALIPDSQEPAALDFAKRMRSELRHRVMKRLPIKVIPFFEIEIDYGEKNRLHVESLLRKDKEANDAYQAMLKQKESEQEDN
jgi:ribosome-binding factor A